MTANEAIAYIHSVCWKGSVPGLSRTEELLRRMGDPQKKLKFIHIVGTNGKGSTAAMLSSVLQKAGYRTGLYTSPYIFRFHERMQVNGQEISDEALAEITEFVRPLADSMTDSPTEFELVTAIAMEFFHREQTDIVVLEAGMGGSLDSTNIIPAPEVAVICNIGLDHTEYLGNTLSAIAETKAGILKPGCDCVLYPSDPEVESVVRQKCRDTGVALHPADFDAIMPVSRDLDGQTFHWNDEKDLKIPLLGRHQLFNTSVVLKTLEVLQTRDWHITTAHIRQGLAETRWPGRFEVLGKNPLFLVDGGHNPQCMAALVENIRDYLSQKDLTILTGVMADKDTSSMFPPLLPYACRFVTVTPDNPRAMDSKDLADYLRGLGADATSCGSVAEGVAVSIAKAKDHGGAVLACGSLYMVGEVSLAVKNLLV